MHFLITHDSWLSNKTVIYFIELSPKSNGSFKKRSTLDIYNFIFIHYNWHNLFLFISRCGIKIQTRFKSLFYFVRCSVRKCVLRNFGPEACNFIKNDTLAQVVSRDCFCLALFPLSLIIAWFRGLLNFLTNKYFFINLGKYKRIFMFYPKSLANLFCQTITSK